MADLKITGLTELTTPVATDLVEVVDVSDTTYSAEGTNKKVAAQTLLSAITHAATEKTTPVDADEVGLIDSAASNVLKRLTWANIKANMSLYIYPVGAIYTSVVSTSPATLFGGTWSAFAAGRVLVGIDSGDTDFDTVEETRGAKTHTLTSSESGLPVHSHSGGYLTVVYGGATANPGSNLNGGPTSSPPVYATNGGTGHTNLDLPTTGESSAANASSAHNNIQPSIVVYMWKRTA